MKQLILTAAFLITLSVPGFCQAITEESLDWAACVKETRQNNPELVAASQKITQSWAGKMKSVSGLLPQISGSTDVQTAKAAAGSSKSRASTYSYGLNGQQLVFDGFKTAADIEQAQKIVEAFHYGYAVTSSNVRLKLRTAYAGLLRAQELLHLTEQIAEKRKQNQDMIRLRYEAGREHRGSLLTAQADLAQANFEVDQAMRNVDLSIRRLAKELGRTRIPTPLKAAGSLDFPDRDKTRPDFESLAETTPLLQRLIVEKEAAKYGVSSAQSAFFPQVYASAALEKSDSVWLPQKSNWVAGATVSMPFFDGGNLASTLVKNRAVLGQAEADEKSGRDGVLFTLEQTWASFRDARDQVWVQRKYLEANREREKIATAQYSSGLLSFNEWIIIEDNLVKAAKSYLDAQAAAMIAEAAWIQAKGETLDEA
ncbi:MAG: TolC family protein [Candidatus Omnitrophota bacterium]